MLTTLLAYIIIIVANSQDIVSPIRPSCDSPFVVNLQCLQSTICSYSTYIPHPLYDYLCLYTLLEVLHSNK